MNNDLLAELINALCCMPGIGKRSASRIALHLLTRNRPDALRLAQTLEHSVKKIKHCQRCRMLTEHDLCQICSDPTRDATVLCIVENHADLIALEKTGLFKGLYFVLMGKLSPLDGIGPDELGIEALIDQIKNHPINEIIFATNSTVEGEATTNYLAQILFKINDQLTMTRLAHGIPLGGELEYIDNMTLTHAFSDRKIFN